VETEAAYASGKNIDYSRTFPSWNPDSASLRELVDFADNVDVVGFEGMTYGESAWSTP